MSLSRLERILSGLQTRILAMYPGVTFAAGARMIPSTVEAPPRIVWVRAADEYGPAERQSPTQRAVLTRSTAVVAHCWADALPAQGLDTADAAVEALVDALACAIRLELGADSVPTAAEWVDPPGATSGLACLVAFVVRQPVTTPSVPVAQATTTAFDASAASPTDGVLDAGE